MIIFLFIQTEGANIMKNLLYVSMAFAFASAMVGAQAKPVLDNNVKVDVCHIIAANDVIPFGPEPVMLYFGKVISVSENAVDAHLAHGDSTSFWYGEEAAGPINQFREAGATLPAANCYYGVKLDGSIVPIPMLYD
jgi:hypothetical protein